MWDVILWWYKKYIHMYIFMMIWYMIHPRTYILTIFWGVSQWIHFSMVVALTNSIIVIRQLFFFQPGISPWVSRCNSFKASFWLRAVPVVMWSCHLDSTREVLGKKLLTQTCLLDDFRCCVQPPDPSFRHVEVFPLLMQSSKWRSQDGYVLNRLVIWGWPSIYPLFWCRPGDFFFGFGQ